MKKAFLILTSFALVLSACEKEGCTDASAVNFNSEAKKDDGSCTYNQTTTDTTISDTNSTGNTTNGNTTDTTNSQGGDTTITVVTGNNIDNNTLVADSSKKNITGAFVTNLPDNNAGGKYYYSVTLSAGNASILVYMLEIPSNSTTLKYSSNTGATINQGELNVNNIRIDSKTWYSVIGSTQNVDVKVDVVGDKITFSWKDLSLADNFLQMNVIEQRKFSAKFTLSLTEFKSVPKDGSKSIAIIK